MTAHGGVTPRGPVFVSYRQSDGTDAATGVAWALRAAGVPVWQDITDLGPGDTSRRLVDALAVGLSGAVLVVTPEIDQSAVVRHEELPTLLGLERDADFVLAVYNTVRTAAGHVDYGAPDRLLGQPPGTLSRLLQYAAADGPGSAARMARAVVLHRVGRLTEPGAGDGSSPLTVDVQSRGGALAAARTSDLMMRVRPAKGGRLPSRTGLEELAAALPGLQDAVTASGRGAVRVTGGAHLSVALALGCALPATSGTTMTVVDVEGLEWSSGSVAGTAGAPLTDVVGHGYARTAPAVGSRRRVLVYVDLLSSRSDAAYARLLEETPGGFAAWRHVRRVSDARLGAADGDLLVMELAADMRELAQSHDNAELHLLLRAPFATAVLLGRLLNTMTVVAYEFDQPEPDPEGDHRPRYVPSLRLTPTDAAGPVSAVLLPHSVA